MPTIEDVQTWLKAQGFAVPDFVVVMWLELLGTASECMQEAGYTESAQKLAMLHLMALFSLGGGNRYVISQGGPNGASRSFSVKNAGDAWHGHLGLLKTLDPAGCLGALIPESPAPEKRGALFVGIGGCYHGRNRGRRYE